MFDKIKKWYRSLPDKKVYFELLGAVLTIPVLVTVILLNLNNLKSSKSSATPTPQVIRVVETVAPTNNSSVTTVPGNMGASQRVSPLPSCKKEIGPVNISSPLEGQVIASGPVCVTVAYKTGEYCSIQWAVKIDNGIYTNLSDKDICYSNLPNGSHSVSVKIQSAADISNEVILQRNFQYTGGSSAPTPATTSAAITQ